MSDLGENSMKREIKRMIQGKRAVDGAGVSLVRVLGNKEIKEFDPFLMLDSFDSVNPEDYTAGFPTHPHRGMETVTYLISGCIEHEDSLGNKDAIRAGESQWMTAGSGILHQEMPQPAGRMLGFQLWLNLPADEKMTAPAYLPITAEMMPVCQKNGAKVRIIAGKFEKTLGVQSHHIPASIYDVELEAGAAVDIPTVAGETVFIFCIEGGGSVNGEKVPEKTAVLFGDGDSIAVAAETSRPLRFIFFSGKPLHEPVAWGGPIVMNTYEQLETAFQELSRGTFIKHTV